MALPLHARNRHPAEGQDSGAAQIRVSRLSITGNRSFSGSTLKGLGLALEPKFFSHKKFYYRPAFSFSLLKRDTALVRRFYESNGFLKIALTADTLMRGASGSRPRVRVAVSVREGPRTTISKVRVAGVPPDAPKLTKGIMLKDGAPLRIADLNRDIRFFMDKLGELGYLEASAGYDIVFSPDSLGAEIAYTIRPGPHIRVGAIRITGIHDVDSGVVRRELRFREKDLLTTTVLRNTVNSLYATNLFSFALVSFDSLLSPQDTSDDSSRVIRATLIETKFFTAEASAGFQTLELARGRVEVSYDNFFGRGIRGLGSAYANYLNQGIDLGIGLPWIFGIPVTFNQTGSYFHRREGIQQSGFFSVPGILWDGYFSELRSTLAYKVSQFGNAAVNHTLQTRTIEHISATINPDSVGNPFSHSVGLSLVRDSRTDLFDPSQGSFSNATFDISGITGAMSNHYVKIEGDERVYGTIGPIIAGSALHAGIERLYGPSTVVPIDQKFYLGGPAVMRGFYPKTLGPDSTGGTFYIAWNVAELRFPVYKWFAGDVFFDMGNLWNVQGKTVSEYTRLLSDPGFRYNAGAGLRVHFPIFILSLDIGFKLDKRPGESPYAVQLNLGNSF
jgi:outer membrane protein insertion porin family